MPPTRSARRLSALEATFVGLESRDVPFVHGSILSFDRPLALDPLRAHVATALAGISRYRQRIAPGPLGRAEWVDDDDYLIDHHVQAATVAAPGGPRELDDLAAHLLETELPSAHSPWRVWTVHGVAGGRGALITVFHHALIDGIAGFRLLEHVLGAPVPPPAAPGPTPPGLGVLATLRKLIAPRTIVALGKLLLEGLRPATQIGLNPRHTGRERTVASHSVDLAMVHATGNAFGATTNDVVLAAVSGALQRYLARRGMDPARLDDVRAMVPVGRHAKGEHEPAGNRVVLLLVPLAVDEPDPEAALARISGATRQLKSDHRAAGGDLLTALSEATTPLLLTGVLRLALAMRGFNVLVTNVPGPTAVLSVLGSRLVRITPIVNLWPHQAVGVAVASYAGELTFGLHADRRVVPDVDRLRDDLAEALVALRDAATRRTSVAPTTFPSAVPVRPMHPSNP